MYFVFKNIQNGKGKYAQSAYYAQILQKMHLYPLFYKQNLIAKWKNFPLTLLIMCVLIKKR